MFFFERLGIFTDSPFFYSIFTTGMEVPPPRYAPAVADFFLCGLCLVGSSCLHNLLFSSRGKSLALTRTGMWGNEVPSLDP